MLYDKFNSEFTYIVMRQEGLGVMESPIENVKIVFETNNLAEAEKEAKKFFENCVSKEERKSGWINTHFTIFTNISTEEGKKLLEEFSNNFKKKWEESMSEPLRFSTCTLPNGTVVLIEKNELYDGPTKL